MALAFEIRKATDSDLPEIRRVLVDTWHASYDALFGRDTVAELSAQWHSMPALQALVAGGAVLLVAVDETGAVIATVGVRRVDDAAVQLLQLYVLPDMQGRGIGTALMNAAMSHLPGARVMTIEVEPRNARACRFYEGHGFECTGEVAEGGRPGSGMRMLTYARAIDHLMSSRSSSRA